MGNEKSKFPGGVIVYGPAGCGKTRHADDLRRALGCDGPVVDNWWPGDDFIHGGLHLTAVPESTLDADPFYARRAIEFKRAMQIAHPPSIEAAPAGNTCAEKTEAQALKAGDQVRLKSCDVWMTVMDADCIEADCAWFSGRDVQIESFPVACLTTAPEAPF